MTLPAHAQRLFAHLVDAAGLKPDSEVVLERLLEDGDRRDLRWLTSVNPEETLATWLSDRGDRQLSNRSRAFWSLVLDLPATTRRREGQDLWLL